MYLDLFLELIEKNPELQTELLEFWEMSFYLENINLYWKMLWEIIVVPEEDVF